MQRSPWPRSGVPRSGVGGAAVRLVGLLGAACALVLVITVPIGLLGSAGLDRSVSLGFYILGAFLVVIGFAGGSRGPYRQAPDEHGRMKLGRTLRKASLDEMSETISVAAIVVVIGIALLVIGVAVDNRYRLL